MGHHQASGDFVGDFVDFPGERKNDHHPHAGQDTHNAHIQCELVQFLHVLRRVAVGDGDHFSGDEHQRGAQKGAGHHGARDQVHVDQVLSGEHENAGRRWESAVKEAVGAQVQCF